MRGRDLKKKWQDGQSSYGAWSTYTDPAAAVTLGRIGFDFAIIDQEHAPYNIETLRYVIWMLRDSETLPIVRVQDNRPDLMKVALDQGAQGVLVPLVGSVEEARRAVAGCKYPPKGIRGFGPSVASYYGREVREYYENANDEIVVMVQVEQPGLLAELDEITRVEGIDALFIGPSDLSLTLGCFQEWDHPDFLRTVSQVLRKAGERRIPVGIAIDSIGPVDKAIPWIKKNAPGIQILCAGEDGDFLRLGGQAVLEDLRSRWSGKVL